MNIETLKVFRDLVDTGSFSKTARLNYISQSAVSQQIKKLELVLKGRLFTRTASKIELTQCGEKFYAAAKKIVLVYENAMSAIKQLSAAKGAEEIKISTIYSAGVYVLQDYMKRFMSEHPTTKISVEYRHLSQIPGDVVSGSADFGIMAYPYKRLPGVTMRPIGEEEMVLLTGMSDKLADKRCVSMSEVAGRDFIFFTKAVPSRKYIDGLLKSRGVKVNLKMELDNVETIKTAVSSGVGLAILPSSVVREHERESKLHIVRFSDAEVSRPLYLMYNRSRRLSVPAKAFLDMFPENYGTDRPSGGGGACRKTR
ncbi:MAG TPA: LysR family transcriptional regulator [Elusimicrobiales bacterium]|nr:LysR family transcriptional regulator [Elusimicrobiales bacterium]